MARLSDRLSPGASRLSLHCALARLRTDHLRLLDALAGQGILPPRLAGELMAEEDAMSGALDEAIEVVRHPHGG